MKLVLIGGAGVRAVFFTQCLLKRAENLGIGEFVLMDTDENKLEIMGTLCESEVIKSGSRLKIRKTTDPLDAIKNADWIVTTVRAGAEHSRVVDERIALKHGVIAQETTGPGGFSMALRSIGAIEGYCRIAREYAPDAWIFNFTNPAGLVTQAMSRKGFKKIVGICDTPSSTVLRMASALGVEQSMLDVHFFGLNHLSWIGSVKLNGYEILDRLITDKTFLKSVEEFSIFDEGLIPLIKLLPNEYLFYYYHRERALANVLGASMTRGGMIERNSKEMLARLAEIDIIRQPQKAMEIYMHYSGIRESNYMNIEAGLKRKTSDEGGMAVPQGYAGVALDFIEAVVTGEHSSKHVLSVPNSGSIDGFEDEDVVEVSCHIGENGPAPVRIGEIPEHCRNLMKSVKLYEKLTIQAYDRKSKELAVMALMSHPLIGSYSVAKGIVEDICREYEAILGEWK